MTDHDREAISQAIDDITRMIGLDDDAPEHTRELRVRALVMLVLRLKHE